MNTKPTSPLAAVAPATTCSAWWVSGWDRAVRKYENDRDEMCGRQTITWKCAGCASRWMKAKTRGELERYLPTFKADVARFMAERFRVEYQDDAGKWRLWKDKLTRTQAEELKAKIETRVTRIIPEQNDQVEARRDGGPLPENTSTPLPRTSC